MKNENFVYSGYLLLVKRDDLKYRGVDRSPFLPVLLEEEMNSDIEKQKYIWEFYPSGWRRDAYRIFEENKIKTSQIMSDILSVKLITLKAAKEINKIIESHLPAHEIVHCDIWKLDSNQPFPLSDYKNHVFLGYDLAYPGGDYYSAIRNGLFINPNKKIVEKYQKFLNDNGLFEKFDVLDEYVELFKKRVPSEANSTFVIYKISSFVP